MLGGVGKETASVQDFLFTSIAMYEKNYKKKQEGLVIAMEKETWQWWLRMCLLGGG